MRHGFIRPPLHFSPVPFAPYYSHLTASRGGGVRVRALCAFASRARPRRFVYFALSRFCTHARARLSEGASRQGKREGERGRHVHTMWPLHLMRVPFAPYCLSHRWGRERRRRTGAGGVIWWVPERQLISSLPPRDNGTFCVCLFVHVCCIHSLRLRLQEVRQFLPKRERKRKTNKLKMTAVSAAECE